MNKGRRQELKQLKYKKRIKKFYDLSVEDKLALEKNPKAEINGRKYDMADYKSHSAPCSCYMCSGHKKFKRTKWNSDIDKQLKYGSKGEQGNITE